MYNNAKYSIMFLNEKTSYALLRTDVIEYFNDEDE